MTNGEVSAKDAQVEMVKRLLKPGAMIVAQLDADKADLLHCAVGVMDEVVELMVAIEAKDYENVIEECGDIYFYGAGIELNLGCMLPERGPHKVIPSHPKTMIKTMLKHAGELLDLVKKRTIFNKEVAAVDITQHLGIIYAYMRVMLREMGYTPDYVRDKNIEKLGVRHASGVYSDAGQNARADKIGTPEAVEAN